MKAAKQSPEHQIIRQAIETPMGFSHIIECACGKRLTMTNSLKIAQERADDHLKEVAQMSMRGDPVSQVQEHYQRQLTAATDVLAEVGRERNRLAAQLKIATAALERIVSINGSTGGHKAMVAEFKHIARTAIAELPTTD